MSTVETKDAAFPIDDNTVCNGMSLRDWFAGQALVGMIGCCTESDWPDRPRTALVAYWYADAMLAARKTGGSE
jgi:hypothetical protein